MSNRFILSSLLLATACCANAAIEPKIAPFTPAVSDARVGDYSKDGAKYCSEVIIDEHGDFRATVLTSLTNDDKPAAVLHGKVADAPALRGGGWNAALSDGQLRLTAPGGETYVLPHTERTSPTLGAKAPEGAVILFDGKDMNAWALKSGKDWLVENGPATWKILPDGTLEIVAGTDCLITHQKFGDCHLHVEFRTLGWKSNSGVFFETRYETNINETYGRLDEAPNGGFDNCTAREKRLHVRPSLPPLAWQTYDIDFRAPRFDAAGKKVKNATATVIFNGIKIYDDQELDPPTGAAGRLGEAPTGPLMLQEHGMPLQFRNIWLTASHS